MIKVKNDHKKYYFYGSFCHGIIIIIIIIIIF